MHQARLAALIARPDVHKQILGDYQGSYSLGLTLNPENRNELTIRVRVEGEDTNGIARQVTLEGDTIPIIISTNFKAPMPLSQR